MTARADPARPSFPVAPMGSVVTLLVSLAGGCLAFLDARRTDEYAGLLFIAALIVGVVAAAPGAVAAALVAWRRRSRRAMCLACLASAAALTVLWLILRG